MINDTMAFDVFQVFLTHTLFNILLLTFVASCVLFLMNIKLITSRFRFIGKHTWIMLILILILGSYLRLNSDGCPDETGLCWSYVEEARNMLSEQKVYDFWHPRGYSFLLATGFVFFGLNFNTILYLNLAVSFLTILLVFLLSYILFGKEEISLLASLIYSLFPASIFFAGTNVSQISSIFFVTLTFFVYIIALKEDDIKLHILSLIFLVFSIHIRLENSIFIPVFLFGYFLERKSISFEKVKFALIAFLVFMLPLSYYYLTSYEHFGPCGNPELCKQYPEYFSIRYFIPALQAHISELISSDYPLLLYAFLMFSFFYIRKDKKLVLPFIWIATFIVFFCLNWVSLFSNPRLYQVLLHPPLAMLMGYGLYAVKNIFEKRIIGHGIPKIIKPAISILVIILVIFLFASATNVFGIKSDKACLIYDLLNLTSNLTDNECILFENSQSSYHVPKPTRVMDVLLPDKHLATSFPECGNTSKFYYMHINTTMCPISFFGEGEELLTELKFISKISEIGKKGCVTLYGVEKL